MKTKKYIKNKNKKGGVKNGDDSTNLEEPTSLESVTQESATQEPKIVKSNKSQMKKRVLKFNKSRREIRDLTSVSVNYYSLNYKNTKLLPKTEILLKMFNGFKDYLILQKSLEGTKRLALYLDNCFLIERNVMPQGLRKNDINTPLKMNPNTRLDKLLRYCFYVTQPSAFNKDIDGFIYDIKYQIGKDVPRSDRTINGKSYPKELYSQIGTKMEVADMFNQTIIDYLYQIERNKINLNIVNLVGLLSCQNMFNFIGDLVTIKLQQILKPEINSIFRAEKDTTIIINDREISVEFYFKCQLLISRDGELDVEYPCGNLEYRLLFDLLKNRYEMKQFILNYDVDKCGPEIVKQQGEPTNELPKKKSNLKPEYIIPASLATAGIIATPFLLATLGGKTKKNYKNKNKNKKNKSIRSKNSNIK